jgi:hypothetical protein
MASALHTAATERMLSLNTVLNQGFGVSVDARLEGSHRSQPGECRAGPIRSGNVYSLGSDRVDLEKSARTAAGCNENRRATDCFANSVGTQAIRIVTHLASERIRADRELFVFCRANERSFSAALQHRSEQACHCVIGKRGVERCGQRRDDFR